jgi:tetratricopeptide (TPR) repeat protein
MARPPPEFVAFISYRHVDPDRRWAQWLHRALETYRVPRDLRASAGLPARLGRAFRDEEELAASGDLGAEIERALRASRFLIVVCSPRIVDSAWCNREVERFREMGRGDRILALLIEGEPHESFPPALRQIRSSFVAPDGTARQRVSEVDPLAADVRDAAGRGRFGHGGHARQQAKLRIISTLLGVRFDDLVNREQQRRVRRFAAAASMAVVITLAMAALAFFAVLQRTDAVKQREEAERRRDESEAVVRFLQDDVLASFRPERMPAAAVRQAMVELVFKPAAAAVDQRFAGQPLVEAAVRDTLALTFDRIGEPGLALPHAESAVAARLRGLGPDHIDTLTSQFHNAYVLESLGRYDEAEAVYRRTVDRLRAVAPGDRMTVVALTVYAHLLNERGKTEDADRISAEALALARSRRPPDEVVLLSALQARAGVLAEVGQHEPCERLNREALELCEKNFGPAHPGTLDAMSNHAYSLINTGRRDEAGRLLHDAYERSVEVLGPDHPTTIMSMFNWGYFLVGVDRADEGEPLMRQAAFMADEDPAMGPQHPNTQMIAEAWAGVLERLGRAEDAQVVRDHFLPAAATRPATAPTRRPADE